jgi:predicted ribosome quality control (RQC) complex YloA/Tae2 family protein
MTLFDPSALPVPARIEKLGLLHEHAFVVRLRTDSITNYVYCVPDPPWRAVCLTPASPRCNYPPAAWLGPYLLQCLERRVTSCRIVPDEAVLELALDNSWRLLVHFFGRQGNALLVDEKALILAVWRQVPCHAVGTPYERRALRDAASASLPRTLPLDAVLPALQARELEAARAAALRLARQARARLTTRLEKIERDMLEAERAQVLRHCGELLKANYHLLRPGMNSVTVTDYAAPENPALEIALDPAKTPQANMAAYFRMALKRARGRDVIVARKAQTVRELADLDAQAALLAATDDLTALRRAAQRPQASAQAATQARPRPATPPPRIARFNSSDGLLLLVGRTARDNDELTMRLARGNDLWLHTRNRPGAHVVVRTQRARDVPRRTLLEAAQLCLQFSKVADGAIEDVLYVQRKHVSKPKGAKPGLVHVAGGKTVAVRHNARAMKEWMAAHGGDAAACPAGNGDRRTRIEE